MEQQLFEIIQLVRENPFGASTVAAIVSAIIGTGIFSFGRRTKEVSQGEKTYLIEDALMAAPIRRPAYSDRMAYVLAEMSALAYYEFEGRGGSVKDAAKTMLRVAMEDSSKAEKWLEEFAKELLIEGIDSRQFFEEILKKSGFKLLGTIDIKETQAFACKYEKVGEEYIVVAFRGTEQKISDWLTDARAIPFEATDQNTGKTMKVHTGFREALLINTKDGKTVFENVTELLGSAEAKDANGKPLPVFVTGHSLGGALALLTARDLDKELDGACYTYGAPRVGNYEHFRYIKMPVFRIVNSVDIVPRVPPGALIIIVLKFVQALSWLTKWVPPLSGLLDKLEETLDRLNGYRHVGDLRYLTDVKGGRYQDVELLQNPPATDRMMWAWQHLRVVFSSAVTSHGMAIYRRKLVEVATRRNRDK